MFSSFTSAKNLVTGKLGLQEHFIILLLDEGPTLPDLDHAAIIAADPDAGTAEDTSWQPANHPGWPVSLPGDLLKKVAPVMMVVSKVLPVVMKACG